MVRVINLKTKMILAVSLLAAALLTVTGLSARHYFVQQMKELIYNQQFNMLSAVADQVDERLGIIRTELVTTAATLDSETASDSAKLQRFFANRPDTQAMFDNGLYLFSPKGKLLFISPGDRSLLRKDFSDREYLRKTLTTLTPQVSEPFQSIQAHHHPIIMFTAPVFDENGALTAVLAGSIDLMRDNFLSRLANIKLGQQGYLYLYDDSRVMIAHPDHRRIFKRDVPPGVNVLYDKAIAGFEGTGETVTSRHAEVVASFKRLKTTGWILAGNFPQSEAYAPVHRAQHFLLIALLVVFLFALFVVWHWMGHLTAPLISITRQIRALAAGNTGARRISADTNDEIGILAEAFNHLLEELEEQKEELQKQLKFSQMVLDTTPVPVYYKDSDGIYLGCNRAFEGIAGFSRDYIIGKTVLEVAPPHVAQQFYNSDEQIRGKKGLQTFESTVMLADGSHDLLFFKSMFPAADGTPAGLIGAILDITDRKQAESALQSQKEFAESLVLNSSIPTFVLDREHRVLIWNHACERLTGVMASDVIGSDQLRRLFYSDEHPVLAELVLDGRQDLLSQYYEVHGRSLLVPEGAQAEMWYRDPAGNPRYLTMSAAPIRDARGELIGAIETIEDITERKQAQDAHEKTRRQLQLILDAAGEGIYGVDLQGRVTFVNPAAAEMLGWEEEELLGKHQHCLIHHSAGGEGECGSQQCPIHDAFADGQVRQRSGFFWRKNGTSFPVEYISTPIRENGELVGAVAVFKDITERQMVEDQLLKLSQAVMQSPVSVIITDTSGNIEYVNPKFTEISGYEAAEVIGKKPSLLKSGSTPDEVYKRLWGTITAGQVWTGEIYNKKKSGETYWEHATISPIRNAAGTISHYMAFVESITERKRLEEQLRQAQKMEAIGQLAGGVAHDFNNILTVIIGFGQLLQAGLHPDDANYPHMAQILDAADRATHLTKSLLAFSRKQVMLLQQVELNELAQNHTRFLKRIIGEDITLSTSFAADRLTVMADSGQIEQVLMNLATNARDAMPTGGDLSVSTELVQLGNEFYQQHGFGAPGPYALITMTDTGSGMDTETQQKIFEPFFTTKAPGRGTGLGLSIVYGIVKQHGGYITIASQCGFGTTFRIYLPLIEEQKETAHSTSALIPKGGRETILVVEDDPAVRRLVESVLKRYGYRVLVAESGEEAIELFQRLEEEIDLALLDMIMPRMNGHQVCETLRERSPRLKVLFLSGYASDVIKEKGIRVDGVDMISKPAKPLELARKIREMLDAA